MTGWVGSILWKTGAPITLLVAVFVFFYLHVLFLVVLGYLILVYPFSAIFELIDLILLTAVNDKSIFFVRIMSDPISFL